MWVFTLSLSHKSVFARVCVSVQLFITPWCQNGSEAHLSYVSFNFLSLCLHFCSLHHFSLVWLLFLGAASSFFMSHWSQSEVLLQCGYFIHKKQSFCQRESFLGTHNWRIAQKYNLKGTKFTIFPSKRKLKRLFLLQYHIMFCVHLNTQVFFFLLHKCHVPHIKWI